MQYLKITNQLFLVEQEIPKTSKAVDVPKNLNHIFIYDRSGSMYSALDTLIKDLKSRFRTVAKGDTVTVGWFSSPGEFRFPLKGLKITGEADFKALDKVLDANSTTLGSTCFSEILVDTDQVIQDLTPLGNTFALCFLTDGYPTVYPYEKELKAIQGAIKKVSGKIASSLLVGYGNYYNKELMSDMAERFGGSLIHSGDLATFPVALTSFMERARDSEPRILVELHALPHESGAVFSLSDSQVNVYAVENGRIAYAPTKGAVDRVYTLTNKAPRGATEVGFNTTSTTVSSTLEPMLKAAYAAAYVLTQRTKTDLALDVLSAIGDVALVERVTNAFTNAEYGAVEQSITEAIGSPNKRFASGRKVGCLPKPDAFCLLDALDLLMNDSEAEFYPYHDDFKYTKIGVGSKTKDGYPKFEANKESRVPMTGLVWNGSKLNLSIRAKIEGTIDLPTESTGGTKRPKSLGKTYDTFVWRNYTVVKDGFLNTTVLPVTLSKASYDRFLAEGVIDKEHNRHYKGRVYTLHLDRIPVINRQVAEGRTSAKQLCKDAFQETKLEAELKVLNFLRNELEPKEDRGLDLGLSDKEETFLQEVGVTRSGFNPPSEKLESTDFYMAKEFEVKIKGFSSLPKVDEVRTKVASKKNLTVSQEVVADALNGADLALRVASTTPAKLRALDSILNVKKANLAAVRSNLQRTKFSVILAKKWFDEFTSRENNVLDVDGNNFTISVREVKVEI